MSRWRRNERGTFIVLWGLLCASMLTMVAIVVDLGSVRATRREVQSVADLAALAGGEELSTATGLHPYEACTRAIDYLNDNLPNLSSPVSASGFCDQQGKAVAKTPCTFGGLGAGPAKLTGTAGEYAVELWYPVSNDELTALDPSTGLRSDDGAPCERMRVIVSRTTDSFFAGVVGQQKLAAHASAVVRRAPATESEIPALWLLDPHNCNSLVVSGGADVTVGTDAIRGVVTIDSDGADSPTGDCTSSSKVTLDANSGKLRATPLTGNDAGVISLYAMPKGATTCGSGSPAAHDCQEADISDGSISPRPVRRDERATRAPVDWKYNCKTNYPTYRTSTNGKVRIDNCRNASALGGTGVASYDIVDSLLGAVGTTPQGYNRYNGPCTISSPKVFPAGNWYIPCTGGFVAQSNVTFTAGNVVFDGPVSLAPLTGSMSLQSNYGNTNPPLAGCEATACAFDSSPNAAIFFIRNGNLSVTGGATFDLHNTVVFQKNGFFKFTGNGTPKWIAPTEGPFASLALWNETDSANFVLSGGSEMSLSGVFFTPYAHPFKIAGGSPASQQDAQFVSQQVVITGGAVLHLSPQQNQAVPLDPPAAFLIR